MCIGGDKFTEDEINKIKEYKIYNKIKIIWCKDNVLSLIYNNAKCLVCPSLYEGFGLPIIEAFSRDCPVVLSNRSCHSEIAQDGGIYFEPSKDAGELVDKLEYILNGDDGIYKHLYKGYIRSNDFNWLL